MTESFAGLFQGGSMADLISCVVTVLALAFTLYFWLLDHLSEDESKFIEGRKKTLASLKKSYDSIKTSPVAANTLLEAVQNVNRRLEVVLNYRFWGRSRQREDYEKVNVFFQDSRFLISTLRRSMEWQDTSLVGIPALDDRMLEDIRADYADGLAYVIEFLNNWN